MATYKVPAGKQYQSWNDVFKVSQQMVFTAFNTGTVKGPLKPYTQKESLPNGYDATKIRNFPVMVFHFKHPEKGDILIDAGFDRSFYEKPPFGNLPFIIKKFITANNVRYTQEKDEDLLFHLRKQKIIPSHNFLTHMHPDHTAGLPVLSPDCHIYYGKKENTFYYKMATRGHFKGKKNIYVLDLSTGDPIAPFERVLDIFGDGTFLAISTPGHTRDHLAYFINTLPTRILIAGDAELSTWGMGNGVFMNTDYGQKGQKDVKKSAEMIRAFHEMYPEVQIWFTHDERGIKE